jgi:hypothetical protein
LCKIAPANSGTILPLSRLRSKNNAKKTGITLPGNAKKPQKGPESDRPGSIFTFFEKSENNC